MKNKDTAPKQNGITRNPFPNSKKVYVQGILYPQIKVGMREIALSDKTNSITKLKTTNEPVTVYDTSGSYSDPDKISIFMQVLNALRSSGLKTVVMWNN